ncbi:MAG: HAMP domain-containing histidine kinase [Kineosporiaceae bacterium]|nr:HAMP domain-containing histidine kinase [Kineosporiaceae bacterium]
MRRSLVGISAAVTSLVAVAFLIPLVVLVGGSVRDRALTEAFGSAVTTGSALAVDRSPQSVEAVIARADRDVGLTSVYLPVAGRAHQEPQIATVIGPGAARVQAVSVMRSARSRVVDTDRGAAVLQPVALSGAAVAVVEVDVPDDVLTQGVTRARLSLAAFALLLVGGSIVLADRLAARVVRSARRLQAASKRLGSGDLAVRVLPEGPDELAQAGRAFNLMADRVGELVVAERELMADLSHRLRTPLAGLVLTGRSLPGLEGDQVRALTTRLQEEVDSIIGEARRPRRPAPVPECDAVEVIRERMDFWGALADDQGRPWSLALPSGRGPMIAPVSAEDLRAVVDALLGNVFLHTGEGCGFEVVLRQGAAVELVVADAGAGIAEPELAVRRGASGAGSSGLGLDIVAKVAQSCGGTLTIGRSRSGGAEITVELPPRWGQL